MPASKAEQVLQAIEALLETVPDAVVERNNVLPEKGRLAKACDGRSALRQRTPVGMAGSTP
jgi:hypothetical protein